MKASSGIECDAVLRRVASFHLKISNSKELTSKKPCRLPCVKSSLRKHGQPLLRILSLGF